MGWLLVSVQFGMAAGMWKGTAQRIAVGYGAIALFVGILPYGALHEGVQMPLDVRLLVLGNLPVLAVAYWLGTTERVGRARWLIVGGLATYVLFLLLLVVLFLLLLVGLPGVSAMEPVSPRVWGGLMLNLILSVSGIVLSFPIGVPLAERVGRPRSLIVGGLLTYVLFLLLLTGLPGVSAMESVSPKVWGEGPDAQPDTVGVGHRTVLPHRCGTGARAAQQPAGREANVRGVHRDIPGASR